VIRSTCWPRLDPPLHARHRKLLQNHLSPATVAALEPAIARIVDDHLLSVVDRGPVDLVATFGDPVPAHTICELIGLPRADVPLIIDLVGRAGALLDGVTVVDGNGTGDARPRSISLGTWTAG